MLFVLIAGVSVLSGCQTDSSAHSDLFSRIVQPEKGGLLRGVELGMDLLDAKQLEGKEARHDDKWGYVYKLDLGKKRHTYVEYICKNPDQRIVSSIVLNIMLTEEEEASNLYNELEVWLRGRYGVGDGNLGRLKWKHEESNLYVTLRILDDKKSISMAMVPASGY